MTKWEYVVLQILSCFWLGITCFLTIHTEVLIYLKILTMTYIQVVCPCHQCVRNLYTLKIFRQWCVMENMCLSKEAPCYSVFGGTWAAWSWLCSKLCVICLNTVAFQGETSLDGVSPQFPVIKLLWQEVFLLSLVPVPVFLVMCSHSFLCTA